jgi:hypothetical protein
MQSRIRPIPTNDKNPLKSTKFNNHLKGSDSQTFHNKAIPYSEINLEKNYLSKLVLGLCSQAQSPRTVTQLDSTKS